MNCCFENALAMVLFRLPPFDRSQVLIANRSLPSAATPTGVTTSPVLPAVHEAADFTARAYRNSSGRALFERQIEQPIIKLARALTQWSDQLPQDPQYAAVGREVTQKIMAAALDVQTTSLQLDVGALAHLPALDRFLPPLPEHVLSLSLGFDGADGAVMPRFEKEAFSRVEKLDIVDAQGVMGDLDLGAFRALERLCVSNADGVGRVDVSACHRLRSVDIKGGVDMEELRLPLDPHQLKSVQVVGSDRLPKIKGVAQDCVVEQRVAQPVADLVPELEHSPMSRCEMEAAVARLGQQVADNQRQGLAPETGTGVETPELLARSVQMQAVNAWLDRAPLALRDLYGVQALQVNLSLAHSPGKALCFDASQIQDFPQLMGNFQRVKLISAGFEHIPDFSGLANVRVLDCAQARGFRNAEQLSVELAKCTDLTLLSLKEAGNLTGTLRLSHPGLRGVNLAGCGKLEVLDLRKMDMRKGVPAWTKTLPPHIAVWLPEGVEKEAAI
jgi:hypothetical protein